MYTPQGFVIRDLRSTGQRTHIHIGRTAPAASENGTFRTDAPLENVWRCDAVHLAMRGPWTGEHRSTRLGLNWAAP